MSVLSAVTAAAHNTRWWLTLSGWSSLGGAVGGIATAFLAVLAYIGGKAGLDDFRAKQRAQTDLANEQAYNMRLDRQRQLHGWTMGMVNVYEVELVTDRSEMERARDELLAKRGSEYAILRVKDSAHLAYQVRELIKHGYIARPPSSGERDALERWVASQHPGGRWIDPPPAPASISTKQRWWQSSKRRNVEAD